MTDLYTRTWAIDDIVVRSGGDGRTVEAYAAIFDTPAEIRDQHGHYREEIDRSAFNRTLSHGIERVSCFYHHGFTIHGTPSDLGSVPLGRPLEIRPDGRGLRTLTRYNKSALADAVLESIRNGDITGQSFRGRIFRSTPTRVPKTRGGELPLIRRMELGLAEYGPTPTPAYDDAGIIAVRSAADVAADIAGLDEADRAELLRILAAGTPLEAPPAATPASEVDPGTEDPRDDLAHSRRLQIRRAANALRAKGVLNA